MKTLKEYKLQERETAGVKTLLEIDEGMSEAYVVEDSTTMVQRQLQPGIEAVSGDNQERQGRRPGSQLHGKTWKDLQLG